MIKIFSAALCSAMPVMKPKLRSNSLLFIEFEDDFVRCHFALRARKSFTTFYKKLLKRKKNTFKSFVTLFFCNFLTKYLDNMILHDSILFQDLIENVS